MILHLYKYNNYFTRQIKGYSTLAEYADYHKAQQANINFNPADGVMTTITFNTADADVDYAILAEDDDTIVSRWFIMEADRLRKGQYKLTLRRDVVYDNLEEVETAPCFIEKADINDATNPLLLNSENMTYNQIKSKQVALKDASKVPWLCIYLAKNAGVISGTIDTNPERLGDVQTISTTVENWTYYPYLTTDFIGPVSDIKVIVCSRSEHVTAGALWYYNSSIDKSGQIKTSPHYYITKGYNDSCYSIITDTYEASEVTSRIKSGLDAYGTSSTYTGILRLKDVINNEMIGGHTDTEVTNLKNYDGKIIKDSDGNYFYCSVVDMGVTTMTKEIDVNSATQPLTFAAMTAVCKDLITSGSPSDGTFKVAYQSVKYRLSLTPMPEVTGGFSIPQTINGTDDALYNILAIPYGVVPIIDQDDEVLCTTTEDLAMAAASAISKAGASTIYDIQLLPYCPVQGAIKNGCIKINTDLENKTYVPITDSDKSIVDIMLNVPSSNFSFTISKEFAIPRTYTKAPAIGYNVSSKLNTVFHVTSSTTAQISGYIDLPDTTGSTSMAMALTVEDPFYYFSVNKMSLFNNVNYTYTYNYDENRVYVTIVPKDAETPLEKLTIGSAVVCETTIIVRPAVKDFTSDFAEDKKVCNECDLYRLVSPNYSGQFEFNLAKNDGVSGFDVDCTYKPYNPYIHINPIFKSMYGSDFHDARGLICGGDFSFGQLTDKFAEYELQNKNYEQIFNRQIQHMDVNNAVQLQQSIASSIAGTATGIATGAATGTQIAGLGTGTAVGAAVGGVTTGLAGALDVANTIKLQQENRSYSIDMYGYQLGNIRALPYSLTKCSAFTANNKIWPFIEYYTCSDKEKEALRNKLKYDGMTVMAIGYINNYVSNSESFVRGKLIRLSVDDAHMSDEIYNEISKGVYL